MKSGKVSKESLKSKNGPLKNRIRHSVRKSDQDQMVKEMDYITHKSIFNAKDQSKRASMKRKKNVINRFDSFFKKMEISQGSLLKRSLKVKRKGIKKKQEQYDKQAEIV